MSVIVPVYMVERYLSRCLDSIVRQTYDNLEIILVDDGSPDRCGAICDDYAGRDQRIIVLHKENAGVSEARNRGLDIATGEYIMFVDSDDYVDKTIVAKLIEAMEDGDADITMCSGYDNCEGDIEERHYFDSNQEFGNEEVMHLILKDKIGSQPWGKLFKKELFEGVLFPKGRLYEDVATLYLVFGKCLKYRYINLPLYYYTLNQSGISLSEKPNKIYGMFCSYRERLQFAEAHYPRVKDDCLALAFGTAMGSLNYFLRFGFAQEIPNLPLVKEFLRQRKDQILSCPSISSSRKLLFRLFLFNEKTYNSLMKIGIKMKY